VSKRPLGCLFEVVETLVLTLVIFLIIQNFVAQPYRVQQQSMEHTLEPDQYVLVDKLTPRFTPYKRGDIVVFTPPEAWAREDGTPYIKRVIGQPGDVVELKSGGVYVNGEKLDEPYIYEGQSTEALSDVSRWTVGAGELFVMGDHRQDSQDSRAFGPVPEKNIIGRAWLRYWPIGTFGILQTPAYAGVQAAAP
jgi:signal peptidase I